MRTTDDITNNASALGRLRGLHGDQSMNRTLIKKDKF